MAKERLFNLPETKGTFQLKGVVSGTEKEKFYKSRKTTTGKDERTVSFGVEFEKGKTGYLEIKAYPKDEVAFYSSKDKKTEKVKWASRHSFNKEGYRLMGTNLGLTKVVGADGNMQNDKKVMTEFDACDYIRDNLKDKMSVFTKGSISYSSFTDNNENVVRMVKFNPNQISLCKAIDFDDDGYEPQNDFNQTIVFMEIAQEKDDTDKLTGRFIVSAKIVTYTTIEDATFVITDSKLANQFKKNLKPYTAINVWGRIDAVTGTEEVEEDNGWGEKNPMQKVNSSYRRELVITGAAPDTIDKTIYTQEAMEEAMIKIKNSQSAQKDFGDNDASGWGDSPSLNAEDDEEEPW